MSFYTLALFAHILGVLGLFIGMGLQWIITLRLRWARTVAQVREWSSLVGGVGKLGPVSGALLLVAGIYMTVTAWNLTTPWIVASLAAMLLMMALGMGVTTRRLKAIQRAAATVEAPAEAIPLGLQRQVHDPALWISAQVAGSIALGVVFLMTTKPSLGGSLLALTVALVLGGIVGGMSAPLWHDPAQTPRLPVISRHARAAVARSPCSHDARGGGKPQLTREWKRERCRWRCTPGAAPSALSALRRAPLQDFTS